MANIQAGAQKYSADKSVESANIGAQAPLQRAGYEGQRLPLEMKKIKAEALEITSRMKFNNAKTETEFQKRLTELQMTKLHGNNAKYREKEVEFFHYINNQSYLGKELLGTWRALDDATKTANKWVNDFVSWLKKN